MKKLFITGIIWEIVRFTTLFLTTASKINGDLILFFTSQQFILFYIYYFLILDTEKYCQYLKILTAAKFLSLFTGILYIVKLFIKSTFSAADILYPANIVFIDGLFFIVLIYIVIRYFKKVQESEE